MRRRGAVGLVLAALFFTSKQIAAQPSNFKLTIARKHSSPICTSGYLAVDGEIIAYVLEKPWLNNRPLVSSIPDGIYGGTLRYDHADKWRIELRGVPGRGNIQIHTGNSSDDTEGCILVGLRLGKDLCSVLDSKSAYAALKNAFYGTSNPVTTPDKAIQVTVVS